MQGSRAGSRALWTDRNETVAMPSLEPAMLTGLCRGAGSSQAPCLR